jgi:hypothetical protein
MAVHAELIDEPPTLTEQGGAPYEFRVKYLVTGLTGHNAQRLFDALNAPGLPRALEVCPYSNNLLVVTRTPRTVPNSPDQCFVDIVYQRRRKVVFQQTGENFVVSGGATVQEIETPFDLNGQQLSVSHTYAADDYNFPGETLTQGGNVRVLRPQATYSFQGVLSANFPEYYQDSYQGKINSTVWAGRPASQWLCTAVSFRSLDLSLFVPTWEFQFDFQHNAFGWESPIIFIDSKVGEPPPDLVPGIGYKTPILYPRVDFNTLFAI